LRGREQVIYIYICEPMVKLIDLIAEEQHDQFVESIIIDPDIDIEADGYAEVFPFEVNGKKYDVRVDKKITSNNKSIVEFKFYFLNNPSSLKRKNFSTNQQYNIALQKSQVGITGTGDYFSIFSKVLSIIVKYCNKNKIDFITFTADEENRQKLYSRIILKMIKKYNVPYKQVDTNPLDGSRLNNEEFWMQRIL
jgi:hypothetical protein